MSSVAEAASHTAQGATCTHRASQELSKIAVDLQGIESKFRI